MTPRRRSKALTMLIPRPMLLPSRDERPAAVEVEPPAFVGVVRLDPERAGGTPAAARQENVRRGLFERLMSLADDHFHGSHLDRPVVGERILAHLDALAEAGTSGPALESLLEEADGEDPAALWMVTLLLACLGGDAAPELVEAWVAALDPAIGCGGVAAIAEAIAIQPDPDVTTIARGWLGGGQPLLTAVALELVRPDAVSSAVAATLARTGSPLLHAAVERLLARCQEDERRAVARVLSGPTPSWLEIGDPDLAWEIARARLLCGDLEPLACLRMGDPRGLAALGTHALDVLVLGGADGDAAVARDLAAALPTEPRLLDAIGRWGHPTLLGRLLAAVAERDHQAEAHAALATALGERVEAPDVAAWERAVADAVGGAHACRLRGGQARGPSSIAVEMRRPPLAVGDLRRRADELELLTGRRRRVDWSTFGATLEDAISTAVGAPPLGTGRPS